ncbi:MAG: DUF5711 family protein [Intestinibacillus sp.]
MNENQKVARFPVTKRERRRLLLRSKDGRLRVAVLLRGLTGWLLLFSIILFLAANYRLFLPDNLRRVGSYVSLGLNAAPGDMNTIPFQSSSYVDTELFAGGLAVADSDTLYVAHPGGLHQLTLQLGYAHIALDASEDHILAYDRGGTGLTVTNGLAPLELDWGSDRLTSPILNACMGLDGSFAVVTDEAGYKTAVRVFNKDQQLTYKWLTSEYYVQSAAVSPDGRRMAALAFRQNGAALEGRLLLFDLGRQEVAAECSLDASLGLEVRFLSDTVAAAVCDTGVYLVDLRGKAFCTETYPASDLIGFAFDNGAVALARRSYTKSARSEVVVLSGNGRMTGPLATEEELTGLSLAGGRLALLTTAGLHVYNDKLEPLWTDASAAGGRRVLLERDGTACVLFGKEARLLREMQSEEPIHGSDNLAADTGNP